MIVKEITGCVDCPFCDENDMGIGYSCRIKVFDNHIKETKKFQKITPEWCPIKEQPLIIRYGK